MRIHLSIGPIFRKTIWQARRRTTGSPSGLRISTRSVTSIDAAARTVLLENGSRRPYGALLIATGAEPVRLQIPGGDSSHVFYLRTFADSRAIVERAQSSKRAVVVGASFIGLEVSASLRTRGVAVDVVAPDHRPLEH